MATGKAVAGGFSARFVARLPDAVRVPVRQIGMVAVPLIVSRNEVAGDQCHDVARHALVDGQRDASPIAQRGGVDRDGPA